MTTQSWTRRWAYLAIILSSVLTQAACGYVAAGAAGAVIGHEAAENDDDE